MANSLIFEYFQSCLRKAYEYFGLPRDKDGNVSISMESLRALANQKTASLLKEHQECSSSSSGTSQSDKESLQKEGEVGREREEEVDSGKEKEESASDQSDSNDEPVVIKPNRSITQRLKADSSAAGDEGASSIRSPAKSSVAEGDATNDHAVPGSASDCEVAAESLTVSSASDITTDSIRTCSASELDVTTDSASGLSASDSYVTASEMDLTADSAATDLSLVSAQSMDTRSRQSSSIGTETSSIAPAKKTQGSSSLHTPPTTADPSQNGMDTSYDAREDTNTVEKLSSECERLELSERRASQQNEPDDENDIYWYKFTEDVFTSGKVVWSIKSRVVALSFSFSFIMVQDYGMERRRKKVFIQVLEVITIS